MRLTLLKFALKASKVLPSLVQADLTALSPVQKLTLGIRHTLTMKILELENTADLYLQKHK